jgi:hypothetical protein
MTRLRLLAAVGFIAASVIGFAPSSAGAGATPPPVGHVFIIVLENKDFAATWDAAGSPYLAQDLRAQGNLLTQYYGTSHASLGNYITMVSGQPANVTTQADCLVYADFVGAVVGGIATGQGCIYPSDVPTIANQLETAGRTWRGYMEDMSGPCQHVAPNSPDNTQAATPASQYAARHNPFVYFHSIIDTPSCQSNDVPLGELTTDLSAVASTPNLSFITPDLCRDGHDATCVDGGPGGYDGIDAFLREWVPKILASPAYQQDGLLLITFDESGSDNTACCNEPTGPNTPRPGINGPGGGRVGTLAISPFVQPGTTSDVPYNHYSLLRSLEDLFGLAHLGYAAQDGLAPFGADVYNLGAAAPLSTTTTTAPPSGPAVTVASSGGTLPKTGGGSVAWLGALATAAGLLALGARGAARRLRSGAGA